jgi:hypothetical protein
VRARARVGVSAALLGSAILFGSTGQIAFAAPTVVSSSSGDVSFEVSSSVDSRPVLFEEQPGPFLSCDSPLSGDATSGDGITDTHHAAPMAQSPAIGLPPAVSSGFGLLCVLAACMGLRRFAYRHTHISRRH